MWIIGLIDFLVLVCALLWVLNLAVPGMMTAEALRLIWIVITVVVLVTLLVWVLQMFGVSPNAYNWMNWGPGPHHYNP